MRMRDYEVHWSENDGEDEGDYVIDDDGGLGEVMEEWGRRMEVEGRMGFRVEEVEVCGEDGVRVKGVREGREEIVWCEFAVITVR